MGLAVLASGSGTLLEAILAAGLQPLIVVSDRPCRAPETVDHGPILAQEAVPVLAGDDEATLHERIKSVERRLYPEIIAEVAGA